MVLLKAAVLGIVQGLTEFLPVSSSGHLVFFQTIFGMKEPMLSFDIALHAGTLVAVLVYFHREIAALFSDFWKFLKMVFCPAMCAKEKTSFLWFYILLTMLPTGIVAVLFRDFFESAFSNLMFVSGAWFVTGILLVASVKLKEGSEGIGKISWLKALGIGLAQGIAIMPGVSRSGSTILAGMFLGIKKEDAAKFSFLMSVPAILAAIVMDLKDSLAYFASHETEVMMGFFTAAVTGYMVIRWLMSVIHRGRFFVFGYYCILVSMVSFILTIVRH